MKKVVFIFGIFLICFSGPLFCQKFEVDTLVYNGSTSKYINFVILGDGYTSDQMTNFYDDAVRFKNYLLNKAPYSYYKNYFNVFLIKTPSNESGVKHPNTASDCSNASPQVPVSNPDNYFGSTFDAYGIHRLLVPMNTTSIMTVLANNFPEYDQVFILANTPYYGGSGGQFATASLHTSSSEIAVHEIGHSFAGLADEYWAGSQYAMEKPNMTADNNPNTIKWKNWLTSGTGIGIYQFSGQPWYKPASGTCDMELLNKPFCAVCTETIIEKIHQLESPIRSYSPAGSMQTITSPVYFALKLIKPVPNTLKSEWFLNGTRINKNVDSVQISTAQLISGTNSVSAKVIDTTALIRIDSHAANHLYITTWSVSKNNTGIYEIGNRTNVVEIRMYPNPASSVLNILYKTELKEDLQILIYSNQGILMETFENPSFDKQNIFSVNLGNYPAGTYYVEFKTRTFRHTEKFIKL